MPLDPLADRHLGRDQRQDLQVCHEGDVVEREHIGRIRHRQGQHVAHPLDRQDSVLLGNLRWHEIQSFRVDLQLRDRDQGDPVLAREGSE